MMNDRPATATAGPSASTASAHRSSIVGGPPASAVVVWPRRFAVATTSLYLVAATVQLSQSLRFLSLQSRDLERDESIGKIALRRQIDATKRAASELID